MNTTKPEALLLLPRLNIQNVNAISSPLTWGFPAVTAFTGFAHALQLRVAATCDLSFDGVGIVCHAFEAQVSRPAGKMTSVFHLSRNPSGSDGKPPGTVEEGRAHIEVSLLIGVSGSGLYSGYQWDELAAHIHELANGMRLAGGSVLPATTPLRKSCEPDLMAWPDANEGGDRLRRSLTRRLLPGFALVGNESRLEEHLQGIRATAPQATALDAWLDLSRLNVEPVDPVPTPSEGAEVAAEAISSEKPADPLWLIRRAPGWLVPIPVGYGSISPLFEAGAVRNARDREVPFQFVETLFTIGEWISPHRVRDFSQLLWHHNAQPAEGLYRVSNSYSTAATFPEEN